MCVFIFIYKQTACSNILQFTTYLNFMADRWLAVEWIVIVDAVFVFADVRGGRGTRVTGTGQHETNKNTKHIEKWTEPNKTNDTHIYTNVYTRKVHFHFYAINGRPTHPNRQFVIDQNDDILLHTLTVAIWCGQRHGGGVYDGYAHPFNHRPTKYLITMLIYGFWVMTRALGAHVPFNFSVHYICNVHPMVTSNLFGDGHCCCDRLHLTWP